MILCMLFYVIFVIVLVDCWFGGVYYENFFYSYLIVLVYVGVVVVFIGFVLFGDRMVWCFMVFVGVISYLVYLMLLFVIVVVYWFVWFGDGLFGWLFFFVFILGFLLLVSWFIFMFVEKFSIVFGYCFCFVCCKKVGFEFGLSM